MSLPMSPLTARGACAGLHPSGGALGVLGYCTSLLWANFNHISYELPVNNVTQLCYLTCALFQ